MSNRQARRDQSRQSRSTRSNRPAAARARGPAPSRGSSGPDWLSRPFLLGLAALIIVLGVFAAIFVSTGGGGDNEFVKKLESSHSNFPKDLAKGTKVGKDDAPIKLVAYEDFQCPFCLQYTATQEPQLIEQYVKTGEVQIEFRNLTILGTESALAALAGQCAADQDRFWDYQNKLFTVQAAAGQFKNEKRDAGRFSNNKLKSYAAGLGLDTGKFNTCLDTSQHLDTVQAQTREARQFGISATPGFLVNGSPLGNGAPADMDGWKKVFDTVKAAASATPATTSSPAAGTTTTPAATATATAAR